ncbi:hypothetical protein [Chenggangzhangella methanolivorans]|uniref:Uncharacterized protein n=1 Tax=Chenggangzhangella methanolivorans TaxID=1437009 RepID=A0A9E6RBZ0_9HYPH|nr:hypothetical protein [Chenggangzhangella methanolivorans]QZN98280.1 hypothetical protein K6K41_14105 [Chenggangzhangella methanolivorans]
MEGVQSPDALERHFRERGFIDQYGGAPSATRDHYSRVLVPGGEPNFLLSAHVMSGRNSGDLQVGHQAIFHESQGAEVMVELIHVVNELFAAAGRGDPTGFLAEALQGGEDREQDFGDVRLLVCFPEREPDQDFENIYVQASRQLRAASGTLDRREPSARGRDGRRGQRRRGAGGLPRHSRGPRTSARRRRSQSLDVERHGRGPPRRAPQPRRREPVAHDDALGARRLSIVHGDGRREDF